MLGIKTPPAIDIQGEFYRPLKQIIDEAWPVENPDADKDGIRKFFEACKDYKKSGKLLSAWQTNPYFSTASCAENYNARLMPLSI